MEIDTCRESNCIKKLDTKFIHVFLILPIPKKIISKLNTEFFKFLWNNKPDKIKRTTVCSDPTCWFKDGKLKILY